MSVGAVLAALGVLLGAYHAHGLQTWLQQTGSVERDEMYHTFNMGIGMVLVVARENAERITADPLLQPFTPCRIGRVTAGTGKVTLE